MYKLVRILRSLIGGGKWLKTRYKEYLFHKYCKCGANLTLCPTSNVFVADNGSVTIGDNCDILAVLSAKGNGKIIVGNYSTIRGNSVVGCTNSIKIGDYAMISNNVHIYDNNNHPTDPEERIAMCKSGFYSNRWNWLHSDSAPIVIEDNVWIGERSTVLKGVHIGVGCIIACDSVVTKDIPPYCIAAGNPAKVVKRLK